MQKRIDTNGPLQACTASRTPRIAEQAEVGENLKTCMRRGPALMHLPGES
jgi:hypothetical protein